MRGEKEVRGEVARWRELRRMGQGRDNGGKEGEERKVGGRESEPKEVVQERVQKEVRGEVTRWRELRRMGQGGVVRKERCRNEKGKR